MGSILGLLSASGFCQVSLSFTTVDCRSGSSAEATGINNAGAIVGFCTDSNGTHGFVWRHGIVQLLDYPNAVATGGIAINSSNSIVGVYESTDTSQHAFLLMGGRYTTIDVPSRLGNNTVVTGINDSGHRVGYYFDAASNVHSFLRSASQFSEIAYPGAVATYAYGINNEDSIVGVYWGNDFVQHGFLLQNGSYSTVDYPNATFTNPCSINNNGVIFGYYQSGLNSHLFISRDTGFEGFDLNRGAISVLHFELFGINDQGIVTGPYVDASGIERGFRAQVQ